MVTDGNKKNCAFINGTCEGINNYLRRIDWVSECQELDVERIKILFF